MTLRNVVLCHVGLFCAPFASAAENEDPTPDRYTVEYPAADRFCPPIRSTFYEVTRTMMTIKGKRFRQKPNGGYGLPVDLLQDGKNMLHVGADLGWHQIREPVFAVANGVVRMSIGPDFAAKGKQGPANPQDANTMMWGNFVVIEHKLPDGAFFTTMYGHLATKRLVKTGDIVKAGQPIGTIGRQHLRINGGYKPHLHFGVREGRIAEPGGPLFRLISSAGQKFTSRILDVGEEWVEIDAPQGFPDGTEVQTVGGKAKVHKRGDKYFAPAAILWRYQRPDFPLVGYFLTTDGFRDPVQFLKAQRADVMPAPFLPVAGKR